MQYNSECGDAANVKACVGVKEMKKLKCVHQKYLRVKKLLKNKSFRLKIKKTYILCLKISFLQKLINKTIYQHICKC